MRRRRWQAKKMASQEEAIPASLAPLRALDTARTPPFSPLSARQVPPSRTQPPLHKTLHDTPRRAVFRSAPARSSPCPHTRRSSLLSPSLPPVPSCLPLCACHPLRAPQSPVPSSTQPPSFFIPPPSPTDPTVARAYKQIPGPLSFVHMPLWYMYPCSCCMCMCSPPKHAHQILPTVRRTCPPPPPATPSVPALRGVARRGPTWWGALAIPALVVTVAVTAVTAATAVAYTETHTPSEDVARKCVWNTRKKNLLKKLKFIKLGHARG